jgi:hypothetical protein
MRALLLLNVGLTIFYTTHEFDTNTTQSQHVYDPFNKCVKWVNPLKTTKIKLKLKLNLKNKIN